MNAISRKLLKQEASNLCQLIGVDERNIWCKIEKKLSDIFRVVALIVNFRNEISS